MSTESIKDLIKEELEEMFDASFAVETTKTNTVPHSSDAAITFPNFETGTLRCKIIETCVLYIDIRRSTELSIQHKPKTVAKLYSAFVRAMTYCATESGGHVRGIIGDRIMVIFNPSTCFVDAIRCAELMNSAAKRLLNKYFKANEVRCGIGIDYGRMMVTKTGVRKHGVESHNYKSLVWLGRPANVASKLTDAANKSHSVTRSVVSVATKRIRGLLGLGVNPSLGDLLGGINPLGVATHQSSTEWDWKDVELEDFIDSLNTEYMGYDRPTLLKHKDPHFQSFFITEASRSYSVPPILMTRVVYEGYKRMRPNVKSITEKWYDQRKVKVPGYSDKIYGGDVTFIAFNS